MLNLDANTGEFTGFRLIGICLCPVVASFTVHLIESGTTWEDKYH